MFWPSKWRFKNVYSLVNVSNKKYIFNLIKCVRLNISKLINSKTLFVRQRYVTKTFRWRVCPVKTVQIYGRAFSIYLHYFSKIFRPYLNAIGEFWRTNISLLLLGPPLMVGSVGIRPGPRFFKDHAVSANNIL